MANHLQELLGLVHPSLIILWLVPDWREILPHHIRGQIVNCVYDCINIVVQSCRNIPANKFICQATVGEKYVIDPMQIMKLAVIWQSFRKNAKLLAHSPLGYRRITALSLVPWIAYVVIAIKDTVSFINQRTIVCIFTHPAKDGRIFE